MSLQARSRIESPQQLRRAIARLSPKSPITDRFSAQWRRLGKKGGRQQEQKVVWYKTQHEHWLGWLRAYDGPGAYRRMDWNRTAEFVYNHIVNPQMLVYLAEASGVDRMLITKATRRALAGKSTMSSMSGAIRGVLTWSVIEAALHGCPRENSARNRGRRNSWASTQPRPPSVLRLTLHREFFAAIAAKSKRIEYREQTPYWKKRLEGRHYDVVHFRNGYATKAPEMWVEFLGLRRYGRGRRACYAIRLGRILKLQCWKPRASDGAPAQRLGRSR